MIVEYFHSDGSPELQRSKPYSEVRSGESFVQGEIKYYGAHGRCYAYRVTKVEGYVVQITRLSKDQCDELNTPFCKVN